MSQEGKALDDGVVTQAVALAAGDGELALHAVGWSGSIRVRQDDRAWLVPVAGGTLGTPVGDDGRPASADDVVVSGTAGHWAALLADPPAPPFTDPFGGSFVGMSVSGMPLPASRHLAVRRIAELLRHARNGTDPAPVPRPNGSRHGRHDAAVGRYVHLDLDGVDHRIYYEEAGSGIGLLCQHTAGADGRQWRHLLEDTRITDRFRVVVYDLPYHARSLPPESTAWWAQPYKLTKAMAMAVPTTLAGVLGLDRPVFIGSSVGGMLALDLARHHADDYRAVIACEGALHIFDGAAEEVAEVEDRVQAQESAQQATPPPDPAEHAAQMMSWMGATAPEGYRQETRLHYAQGAPGVFLGDINYFAREHDLRGEGHLIDTSRCEVHLLTGEYDYATMSASKRAAEQIPGSTFQVMTGMGHFPMSEDPERFAEYVLPILDAIADGAAGS
jgi:pimeloyl-ACP methyl ester carboxylesterase